MLVVSSCLLVDCLIQRFYLIIEIAVGGTNGYFPDGEGNKVCT